MRGDLSIPLTSMFGFLLVLARVAGTFVFVPLPGMKNATAIVHAAPVLGAAFTQYTAEFEPGGALGPALAPQSFRGHALER